MLDIGYPISAFLEITSKCNLRCKHCYNNSGFESKNKDINYEKLIKELSNKGVSSLTISGGEPLLYPDLFKIINLLNENKIKTCINTNGLLLTKQMLSLFLEKGVDSMQISIDGAKDLHEYIRGKNTYDLCVKKIKLAVAAGFIVKIGYTINALNYNDIEKMIFDMKKIGVKSIAFYRYIPSSERDVDKELVITSEILSVISKKLDELRTKYQEKEFCIYYEPLSFLSFIHNDFYKNRTQCLAGVGQLNIDVNGNVLLCAHNRMIAGNIFDESIEDIWKKQNKTLKISNNIIPKNCENCKYSEICRGGCKGIIIASNLDPHVYGDPACFIDLYRKQKI